MRALLPWQRSVCWRASLTCTENVGPAFWVWPLPPGLLLLPWKEARSTNICATLGRHIQTAWASIRSSWRPTPPAAWCPCRTPWWADQPPVRLHSDRYPRDPNLLFRLLSLTAPKACICVEAAHRAADLGVCCVWVSISSTATPASNAWNPLISPTNLPGERHVECAGFLRGAGGRLFS